MAIKYYEQLQHIDTNKGPAVLSVESLTHPIASKLLGYKDLNEFMSKFDSSEFDKLLKVKDQFYEEFFDSCAQRELTFSEEVKNDFKSNNLGLSYMCLRLRDNKYREPIHVGRMITRLNTDDQYIVSEIMLDNYCMNSIVPSKENIKNVVDLGAHIGSYSIMAAILFSNAKIYSYEAAQENYDMAVKNITINGLSDRILITQAAVGGKGFPQELLLSGVKSGRDNVQHQSIRNTGGNKIIWSEEDCGLDLKTTTLKEIVEQNNIEKIDILKMDIEGSEYQVLEHAYESGTLEVVDKMVLELHVNPKRGRTFDKIFKYLYDDFSHIVYNKHNKVLIARKL